MRRTAESLGATAIEPCFEAAAGQSFPKATVWVILVLLALAALPPLWIARTRLLKSATPRLEIFDDMDFQPKFKAQAASPLFADGRAMRPPVPGTLHLGSWNLDDPFYSGKSKGEWITTLPMRPSRTLMERGQERFNVYCATCHGWLGEGNGMIAKRRLKRGDATWVPPSSLVSEAICKDAVGYWVNAARFANWLQNGQPTNLGEAAGSTETGAYTLNGATRRPL